MDSVKEFAKVFYILPEYPEFLPLEDIGIKEHEITGKYFYEDIAKTPIQALQYQLSLDRLISKELRELCDSMRFHTFKIKVLEFYFKRCVMWANIIISEELGDNEFLKSVVYRIVENCRRHYLDNYGQGVPYDLRYNEDILKKFSCLS